MDFTSLPEDLYFYFPLELGSTCKKFNAKINIYNRNIIAIGKPTANYIKYKKLKKIDLTNLHEKEIYIILTKIKPIEIVLEDTRYLTNICLKNTKLIEIESRRYYGVYLNDPENKKIFKKIAKKNIKIIINKAATGYQKINNLPKCKNVIIKKLSGGFFNEDGNILEKFTVNNILTGFGVDDNLTEILNTNESTNVIFCLQFASDQPSLEKILADTKNFVEVKHGSLVEIDWLKKYVESGRISLTPFKKTPIFKVGNTKDETHDPDKYVSDSGEDSEVEEVEEVEELKNQGESEEDSEVEELDELENQEEIENYMGL